MRTGMALTAVLAVLAAGCAHGTVPAGAPATAGASAHAALEQRYSAFLAALAARDAAGVTAFFADDATLHVAGMPPVGGRAAIGSFYSNVFRAMSASRATPEASRVSTAGDMAWTSGRVVNTFQSAQGPTEFAGKYLLVWERRADEWVIVVYGISSNQPT
jgi:uncharacterized protein (TIGR02246 family)